MRKLLILFAAAAMIFAGGCSDEYDDSALSGRVDNLENRVAKLEELCRQMNTNISSLQTIVTALQNNDYVTGVTPVTEGGQEIGYTITFSKSAPITIYHGRDGKDGVDGTDGKDGVDGNDGHTPVIGVRQDTDGIYYWTLDGEWLLDSGGNKVKAEGRDGKDGVDGQPGADGKDGVTPQLKIEEDYWYVSTDGGATWTNLGKATADNGGNGGDGQEGGSSSVTVTQDDGNVYFTLGDGTVITLPKIGAFDITFEQQEGLTCEPGGTVRIAYTIVGGGAETRVESVGKDGWLAEVEATSAKEGHIVITAPTNRNNGKVLVFASSEGQTVMKSLTIGSGVLTGISDAYQVKNKGGELKIRVRTNLAYTVHVDEDSQSWISAEISRAEVRTDTLTVTVQPNPAETERVGHFELRSDEGSMLQRVEIIQSALELPKTGCIEFFDDTVKAICVANFDTNKDGEISYEEAAAVTDLGELFRGNSEIASFDELQYFTSLTNTANIFDCCTYLLSVTLPEGLTEIGESAFNSCKRLQSIRIPDSVNKISSYAFGNCSQLFEVQLPAELKKIEGWAFRGCVRLTELVLPDGVNEIGCNAFEECGQLRSINIPDGIVCISAWTFDDCKSLAEITLPESLQTIESYAFIGCVALREIVIPKRVKRIDSEAFRDCEALTAVTLPERIAEINYGLFSGCDALETIELPQFVNTIGAYAFSGCKSLKNIDLSRVNAIGYYAFCDCSALESVQLSEKITDINIGVFTRCTNLASFKLPNSVARISNEAFMGCTSLTSIGLPATLTYIGSQAFGGCTALADVYCAAVTPPDTEIGIYDSFSNTPKTQLFVPKGSAEAYKTSGAWAGFQTITEQE